LAQGLARDESEARSLRARQLAAPRTRRRLARCLRRVAESDPRRFTPFSSRVALTPAVYPLREAFAGLAERLESPAPINVCGIARVIELLTDGAGPLYNRKTESRLGDAIWWVADGLEAQRWHPQDTAVALGEDITDGRRNCPPHAWGCPVIMKLDPGHVAWTCARCGTVATTGDPAVRPG
jgi:hypothetical protein